MADYLFFECEGVTEGAARLYRDAASLVAAGNAVTLVLLDNGVLSAVRSRVPALEQFLQLPPAAADGQLPQQVWADAVALRQRGIDVVDIAAEVRVVEMAEIAGKLLEPGLRAVWH